MSTTVTTAAVHVCEPATRMTRSLLAYGVIAGPLYLVVALAQALTREGFDATRHAASLLSNGDLGWIQITNLLVTGAMVVAGAVGTRRALCGSPGGTWGPRLLGIYGAGLIGAGVFVADPMSGFPAGTPEGPGAVSWHGLAHFAVAGLGFLALTAACFVIARGFARQGENGWAWYSWITGAALLAGFVGIASGSGSPVAVIGFWVAVVIVFGWLSVLSARLCRRA